MLEIIRPVPTEAIGKESCTELITKRGRHKREETQSQPQAKTYGASFALKKAIYYLNEIVTSGVLLGIARKHLTSGKF